MMEYGYRLRSFVEQCVDVILNDMQPAFLLSIDRTFWMYCCMVWLW